MPLNIYAIASYLPKYQEHTNLLGPVLRSANNHLFTPAGGYSRPSIVGRGSTRIASEAYQAPTAELLERASDLACRATEKLIQHSSKYIEQVEAVIHSQCTLDQQISGSCCLRLQDEFFSNAELTLTIGQLGTAGIPTVFELTNLSIKPGQFACVSAADKWLAPFVRHVPKLVTFGDASAACIVGKGKHSSVPVAIIEDIVVSCQPQNKDIWKTSPTEQQQHLLNQVRVAIDQLLTKHPDINAQDVVLVGDGYGEEFGRELSSAFKLQSITNESPNVHLSSASPLFAISQVIKKAADIGKVQHAIIWTVSQSGNAGALLVKASPEAINKDGVWLAPSTDKN